MYIPIAINSGISAKAMSLPLMLGTLTPYGGAIVLGVVSRLAEHIDGRGDCADRARNLHRRPYSADDGVVALACETTRRHRSD